MLSVFILTFRMMSDDNIILFICNNVFFFSLTSVSTKNYIKYIVFPLKTLVKIHQAFFFLEHRFLTPVILPDIS